MVAYVLLITLLSHGNSGTIATSSMAPTFQSKELCEAARDAYIKEAGAAGSWWSGKPEAIAICAKAS